MAAEEISAGHTSSLSATGACMYATQDISKHTHMHARTHARTHAQNLAVAEGTVFLHFEIGDVVNSRSQIASEVSSSP